MFIIHEAKSYTYADILKIVGKQNEGLAYIIDKVLNRGMSFTDACDDENYYGDRADIVKARNQVAHLLKTSFGYKGDLVYHN